MKKKSPKRKVKKLKEVPTLKNYTINQESTRSRVKISPIKQMPSLQNLNLKSTRSIANFKNTQLTSSVIMNSDLDSTAKNINTSPMSKSKMKIHLNSDLDHDF